MFGKAQDAVAALPIEDSLNYELVKAAVLRAYELVPEAYRQKFRNYKKNPSQTYVEFAREKGTLFDKWCSSSKAPDYKSLREMILIEEFKRSLPDRVVVYMNERKVSTLLCAAVLADEYVLTHKITFGSQTVTTEKKNTALSQSQNALQKEERTCFYCRKPGHVIANCLTLKHKEQTRTKQSSPPKGIGLIKEETIASNTVHSFAIDNCFSPFTFTGEVSLPGGTRDQTLNPNTTRHGVLSVCNSFFSTAIFYRDRLWV